MQIPCFAMQDEDWSRGFDFVSIDVEGTELEVLKKVPIKVMVIEWRAIDKDLRAEYLSQFGYVRLTNVLIFDPERGDEIFYRPDLIQPHIKQPKE